MTAHMYPVARSNRKSLILLFLGGGVLYAVICVVHWGTLTQSVRNQQANLVELSHNALYAQLTSHEIMLGHIGEELNILPYQQGSVVTEPILDNILGITPSIVGFGYADPNGNLIRVSSNLSTENLPNLLVQPESRNTFMQALHSRSMVVGRTYYMPNLSELVIPIRKAIYDSNDEIVGVMTAGMKIESEDSYFSNRISLNESNRLLILRGSDAYLQYETTGKKWLSYGYKTPVKSVFSNLFEIGFPEAYLNDGNEYLFFESIDVDGLKINVAKYDERYDLWVISQSRKVDLYDQFIKSSLAILSVILLLCFLVFLLVTSASRAEKKRRESLFYQATHDPLTNLPNREYLLSNYQSWKEKGAFSLLFIDMDFFKNINDNFGHELGDKVLQQLSERIAEIIQGDAVAFRHGGDEFLVLTSKTSLSHLDILSRKILHRLSQVYTVNGLNIELGVSIGVSRYPEHGEELDQLLKASDIAMYEAKNYRNTVRFFDKNMLVAHDRKMAIEKQLRTSIVNDEFSLLYQPQVDHMGKMYGVECLLRWHNLSLGSVSPVDFIPVAEANGLMPRIGSFVLLEGLGQLGALQEKNNFQFKVAINISVQQFVDNHFVSYLKQAIAESKVSPELITLEITESLFAGDFKSISAMFRSVKQLGVNLSLDDFGTGYSSLSMVSDVEFDELKIDKSFINKSLNDISSRRMVDNIIAIGRNFNMNLVAEGVETNEQFVFLKAAGCDFYQGYYFSKPITIDELEEFVGSF